MQVKGNNKMGYWVAGFGFLILAAELFFHYKTNNDFSLAITGVAAVVVFIGGWMVSPTSTKEAATILVEEGIRVIEAVKEIPGRRSTDPAGTTIKVVEKAVVAKSSEETLEVKPPGGQ